MQMNELNVYTVVKNNLLKAHNLWDILSFASL